MSIQKGIVAIGACLIGVAIGILASWAVGLGDGAQVQVLEGYAWVNEEGTAIALSPDGETPGASYVVAGGLWREQSGPWHDTFPTCLELLASDLGYGWVFWMLALRVRPLAGQSLSGWSVSNSRPGLTRGGPYG